ncbi:MerR family transcriptional regulator [Bacillus sp. JCM 19041]|uniref:MerR family transcriptional regulator n=1 Tax=Bacillus sp. JCM 19041 TaxID=1460637 RepID=UPI0009E97ED9
MEGVITIYKIGEVAKNLGVKEHTLRYYEQIGLIVPKRNENNIRLYSDEDQNWVEFVLHMKETGMTLENLKKYIDYSNKGNELDNLLDILYEHKKNVKNRLKMYEDNLMLLEKKIHFYEESRKPEKEQDLFRRFVEDHS